MSANLSGLDNRQVIAFLIPMFTIFTIVCICIRCCIKWNHDESSRPQSATHLITDSRAPANHFNARRNSSLDMLRIINERHRRREEIIQGHFRFPEASYAHASVVQPLAPETRRQPRAPSPPPTYSTVVAIDSSLPAYKDCVAV